MIDAGLNNIAKKLTGNYPRKSTFDIERHSQMQAYGHCQNKFLIGQDLPEPDPCLPFLAECLQEPRTPGEQSIAVSLIS